MYQHAAVTPLSIVQTTRGSSPSRLRTETERSLPDHAEHIILQRCIPRGSVHRGNCFSSQWNVQLVLLFDACHDFSFRSIWKQRGVCCTIVDNDCLYTLQRLVILIQEITLHSVWQGLILASLWGDFLPLNSSPTTCTHENSWVVSV